MDGYSIIAKVGEGTFGEVFKAQHIESGRVVALKKIRIHRLEDGIPKTLLREIKAMELVIHPNVVRLFEFFPCGSSVIIAIEFMQTDLFQVMRNMQERCRSFRADEIKAVLLGLLQGVAAVHGNHIMHRDMKPSNILFSPNGMVKLGDFGLARVHLQPHERTNAFHSASVAHSKPASNTAHDDEKTPPKNKVDLDSRSDTNTTPVTPQQRRILFSREVATRWYRAPELLFGSRQYGVGVDLWAIGCIFAELLNHSPLFPGEHDIDQLYRIMRYMGTPSESEWPGLRSLPDYNKITFPKMPSVALSQVVTGARASALDLLSQFLAYPPHRRITASEALLHPYFFEDPPPCPASRLADLVSLVHEPLHRALPLKFALNPMPGPTLHFAICDAAGQDTPERSQEQITCTTTTRHAANPLVFDVHSPFDATLSMITD